LACIDYKVEKSAKTVEKETKWSENWRCWLKGEDVLAQGGTCYEDFGRILFGGNGQVTGTRGGGEKALD